VAEIEANDYNLNIPRYIDSTEAEDAQDIEAHLRGGIPDRDIEDLDRYWRVLPGLKATLFAPADRPGYCRLQVPVGEVKPAIFGHAEFAAFNDRVSERFAAWREANRPRLTDIQRDDHPKALIETLSESLLETFRPAPLLDAYDVYQHLMDYWAETMQDDVYLLAQEGWRAVLDGKPNTDLIPQSLIVNHFFATEQQAIETLEAERDAIGRQMEELDEEQGGEEGLLEGAKTEKGKLTVKSVKERLKAIQYDPEAADERQVLMEYAALLEREAVAGRKVKDTQKALNAKVLAQYAKLTGAEIRKLVVDDKWLVALDAAVRSELDRVSQQLTQRVKELAERYATPLPQLAAEVETLAARVDDHLKTMGFTIPGSSSHGA
jgi:type I restriction enzyme M protein